MSILPTSTTHKRPVAVTVVGLITLVAALATVAIVLLALGPGRLWQQALSQPLFVGWRLTASGEDIARAAGLLISGGVTFALSLGLFGVRRWAWLGLMTWTGATLALKLVGQAFRHLLAPVGRGCRGRFRQPLEPQLRPVNGAA